MTEPEHIEFTSPRLDRRQPGSAAVAGTPVAGILAVTLCDSPTQPPRPGPVPRSREANSSH
jgi:hypothetical protein